MKKTILRVFTAISLAAMASSAWALSSNDILNKVKSAESGLKDLRANMVITEADKKNVNGLGEGWGEILKLENAVIQFKSPDKIRYDGFARGIKAAYIQNGYSKLVLAPMIRQTENLKNSPGKRQDTTDIGFLSGKLWTDNIVTIVSSSPSSIKLSLTPKFGPRDKRHDLIWLDPGTLKLQKREKYLASGAMRVRMIYSGYQTVAGKMAVATICTMFNGLGAELGTVKYTNIKANVGINDAVFSLSQR